MAIQSPQANQLIEPREACVYFHLEHLIAVGTHGQAPGHLNGPGGVAIDTDTNNIFISEGWYQHFRVSIFSEQGEFLDAFSHEDMSRPWGVAIQKDNVYVTDIDEHCIFRFKMAPDIRFVCRMGGEGSGFGEFREPRQLAASFTEVYVADCENHLVQVLDVELGYLRSISHLSLRRPCDVKLTANEVYVLSCSDSRCVHVFSYSGEKIRSLITRGNGMQVEYALFFCLDASENLIISDRTDDQIKIFTKEGAFLHTFGEYDDDAGGFPAPKGVALINSSKLVVLSFGIYNLQIFSY